MNNKKLFERSLELVPGGVHSPVRSFKGLHTTPIFFDHADGAFLYDVEGKDYIDFCMSFGPLILGHRNRNVEKDVIAALQNGWSFGACEPYSLKLAEFLIEQIPFIEQIRFVNSGTEAVMTALRLARGTTNKNKVIKFNGCYHGHTDSMLIKAGSGLAGTSEASSAGVPNSIASDTLIAELGDKKAVKEYLAGNDIAAIIIEPLPANNGLLKQPKEFLNFLREECNRSGALLIFDEVISGFRIGMGGMSAKLEIKPDIVTYGKIIGGGFPVGALASTRKIMENLAPLGSVYQAGTLSANPLAMIAGLSTLSQLNEKTYQIIESQSNEIATIFSKWLNEKFPEYEIKRSASLFWIAPKGEISSADKIPADLETRFYPLFETLLNRGIYLSPNAYEVGFVSLAHDKKVIQELEKRLWSK